MSASIGLLESVAFFGLTYALRANQSRPMLFSITRTLRGSVKKLDKVKTNRDHKGILNFGSK